MTLVERLRNMHRYDARRDTFSPDADKSIYTEAADRIAELEAAPLAWAVERWNAEVKNRPLVNVHRSALDTTWRQVIRHFGGDPDVLCGPSHYDLVEAAALAKEPSDG